MKKTKNSTSNATSILTFALFVLSGIVIGLFGVRVMQLSKENLSQFVLSVALLILFMFAALTIQTGLHEVGHMIFGIVSGYQFQSIRFGCFILYRSQDRLKLGIYTLTGTAGQCIMTPPEISDEDTPTTLYNLGGLIINILLTVIFAVFVFNPSLNRYFRGFSLTLCVMGICTIVLNALPVESMSNDGYNALICHKDLKSKKAFLLSLRMMDKITHGVPTADIPASWFDWTYEQGDSALASSIGIQRINYLMAHKQYDAAYELTEYIEQNVTRLSAIHNNLVKLNKLLCMIILEKDPASIKEYFEQENKNILTLRQMPPAQNCLYAYYSLIDPDVKKAKQARYMFEQIAKRYPYPKDIEEGRELLQLVDNRMSPKTEGVDSNNE